MFLAAAPDLLVGWSECLMVEVAAPDPLAGWSERLMVEVVSWRQTVGEVLLCLCKMC